jgi:hypothetical protein
MPRVWPALLTPIIVTTAAFAEPPPPHLPRPDERLAAPIGLPGCPRLVIVEWQRTPDSLSTTSPTADALAHLAKTCAWTRAKYRAYLSELGVAVPATGLPAPRIPLSILRAVLPDGLGPRMMNDAGRFPGDPDMFVFGRYFFRVPSRKWMFLRNDALAITEDGRPCPNRAFRSTMIHELVHMLDDAALLGGDVSAEAREASVDRFFAWATLDSKDAHRPGCWKDPNNGP